MERDLGGHARVPVPVGADPRPEPEQHGRGGHAACRSGRRRRRARAGPAIPRSPAPAASMRAVHGAHVAGHDDEQRLVEDRERRAHLVERRRQHGAQVAGVPQERDLLAQAPAQVRVLVGRRERVVEGVEQPADAAQGDEQRAAARLGRVRGQDRVDRDARAAAPRRRRGPSPRTASRPPRRWTRRSAGPSPCAPASAGRGSAAAPRPG